MSGFCKTHIRERTLGELASQKANDLALTKIYSVLSPQHKAAKSRLQRIEDELKTRPVCPSHEPENTEPRA